MNDQYIKKTKRFNKTKLYNLEKQLCDLRRYNQIGQRRLSFLRWLQETL